MPSKETKSQVFKMQEGKCFHCGCELDANFDADEMLFVGKDKRPRAWKAKRIFYSESADDPYNNHIYCLDCAKLVATGGISVNPENIEAPKYPLNKHGKEVRGRKSMAGAVLLALFFNWIGLLYARGRYALYTFLLGIGVYAVLALCFYAGTLSESMHFLLTITGVLYIIAPVGLTITAIIFAVTAVEENNRIWDEFEQDFEPFDEAQIENEVNNNSGMETRVAHDFRRFQKAIEENPGCSVTMLESSMFGGPSLESPSAEKKLAEFMETLVPVNISEEEYLAQEAAFYESVRDDERAYAKMMQQKRKSEQQREQL